MSRRVVSYSVGLVLALALTVAVPPTVAPPLGAVIDVVGAVLSASVTVIKDVVPTLLKVS